MIPIRKTFVNDDIIPKIRCATYFFQAYRLRQRPKLLSGHYPIQQRKSLLNLRKRNRARQRRFRLNQTDAKKIFVKKKIEIENV